MAQRVPFKPERRCSCPLFRFGYAGAIKHLAPCNNGKIEWLAQSGQVIEPGKRCRWITNDDQWSRAHGYESINAVAEITRINDEGMVFAYWHDDDPNSDQYGQETCIPNSAVVEVVDE